MLRAIEIENLRGIRHGRLDDLTPLTVLTGPNGGGKSAVLDALLIGGARDPGKAIGFAVARRAETPCGAQWLVRVGAKEAELHVTDDGGRFRFRLRWAVIEDTVSELSSHRGPYSSLSCSTSRLEPMRHMRVLSNVDTSSTRVVVFAADNAWSVRGSGNERDSDIWLIDPRTGGPHRPLDRVYTQAVQLGRRAEANELVRAVIPGFSHVEILTNLDGTPCMHVVYQDRSVPVALAGDGVQSLIRLCLELASRPAGTVLLEEPEVHQHPASLVRAAKAIVGAVSRGVQVVLSTHSLEIIDLLLDPANGLDLEQFSLFRLRLEAGELRAVRTAGPDAAFERQQIAEDLR